MSRHTLPLVALIALAAPAPAAPPADAEKVAGVWLADAADADMDRPLSRLWFSKVTVQGDKFSVSRLMRHPKDLTGTFTLDPTTSPKSIDLKVNDLDFAELGAPVKIPAMTLRGIYKLDGDRITLCFPTDPDGKRPTEFAVAGKKKVALLTLGRAGPKYTDYPKEVTVTVKGPDGQPVKAMTYYAMTWNEVAGKKDKPAEWRYSSGYPTGPDGTVKVPYEEVGQGVRARAADQKLIGFASASPFSLQTPALTVQLEPEVRLTGTLVCDELKKAGLPLGWTNTQLYRGDVAVAQYMTAGGKFEFPVPAGEYVLEIYGEDLVLKRVPVNVLPDRSEVAVPPINLSAANLPSLKGKPAPELKGVVGWKGEKVRLADLKGKYVLLEFWGYWCGPCVASMPVLFELHDRFKDKGLAVIGIHLDADGDIDTAAKLDEKLVDIRKETWKGRDLPFPVALCSGEKVDFGGGQVRGGPAVQYGVLMYPTTILIDRDGKVVGRFHARDAAEAVKEMEKLLAK